MIQVTGETAKDVSAKAFAIKSGSRYVDEVVVMGKACPTDCFVETVDPDAGVKRKEQQVKASFKVEMSENEKIARDSTTTNLYHTGQP